MFNAIKLVAPLDKSLKSKRTQMEKVLTAYGKALDYGVAEVTTAATYGMGELYRQLGADLMASERPKGLDAEAKEQYDVLLEEQAFPFEEKSIELHETNAQAHRRRRVRRVGAAQLRRAREAQAGALRQGGKE